ncbi:MAG: NAD(P)/FAD-dependent oxidoreductase [Planctomycetota bacterium]|nr:MAG: NAD(P)/FAD-dependent oxidoreductase [Planctomycetota bacterium]
MPDYNVIKLTAAPDVEQLACWDVVIVGAGPAGLAAGLTTAHRGLTTLVVEAKNEPGGQPHFLYPDKVIADIPGFPEGVSGEELARRQYQQAVDALVQFRFEEELVAIDDVQTKERELKRVVTNRGSYLCRRVILACGLLHFPRRLPVLEDVDSPCVQYRLPRDRDLKGMHVLIVGGGDSALDAALMVLGRGGQVELLVRKPQLAGRQEALDRVRAAGGTVRTSTEITAAQAEGDQLRVTLTGGRECVVPLVIVQIGYLAGRETFERLGLRLQEDGGVAVDQYYETSRPGIFAVGDVHGDIKLVPVAWADGIQAAIYAFKEITSPYWLNEKRLHDQRLALLQEKLALIDKHAGGKPDHTA